MNVKKISDDVKSLLNASTRINNFKRAVEELVYNSLDAESSSIAIRVHIPKMCIQVVDNGTGIIKIDFKLLGERYATSKLLDVESLKGAPSKYGYQGQALANIIEISQSVKITSRYANSNETWIKTFSKGKNIECRNVAQRPSKGTTVEVNGFLFNLRIQRQSINQINEILDIKTFLEQMALVFNNVSITLRDDSNMEILLKIYKNRNIYQTFLSLFEIYRKDLKELQIQKNEYKVKAFIGTSENYLKKIYWIFLNNKMVHNSNLHNYLNNKLYLTLNLTRAKIKKIAFKGVCNKEDNINYKCIPMYFVFLSCPYYDYDIIYSGKQTVIEFKDWEQVHKLIQKLVEVYKDDLSLINKQKNYNLHEKQASEIAGDARNEIKKLIQKFLGSHNKKPRVSQMQNGIRGKYIKRKNRKEQPNVTLTGKKYLKCEAKYKDKYKIKKTVKKKNIKAPLNNNVSNIPPKPAEKKNCSKINVNHKYPKNAKQSINCKCFKKDHNFIDQFKNITDTIRRRCNVVSSNMEKLLKLKNCEGVKEPLADQIMNKTCISTSTKAKSSSTCRNRNNFIERSYLTGPNYSRPYVTNDVQKISSYDLLQTIINTQQNFCNPDIEKQQTYISMQSSNVYETNFASRYDFAPKLTFDSHKYVETRKKIPGKVQKNNSLSNTLNTNPYKPKLNLRIKAGPILKKESQYKNYNFKKNSFSTDNKLLNECQQYIFKTIDASNSDVIGFSKKIRCHIMNDINQSLINANHDTIQYQFETSENYEINLNIENTYTISMNSLQNTTKTFNLRKNSRTFLDESVTKDSCKYINHQKKTNDSNIEVEKNKEIASLSIDRLNVIIPESQDSFSINESIEPLTICEAVINSPGEKEEEVNDRLNFTKDQDSLLILDYNENSEANVSKLQINVPKGTNTDVKNSQFSTNVLNKDVPSSAKDLEDETYITRNDSVGNFNLTSRLRFIPKGMSPIFENCFSKNICSYNIDGEYYEDVRQKHYDTIFSSNDKLHKPLPLQKIYNRFANEIAKNSELFEPQIHNMNEYKTGYIQNFTNKFKNQYSDLVFGSESLTDAKVILGQVDCKFIAAIIHSKSQETLDFLVLFDQHAVHERIMLENNLSSYLSHNKWKKVTIDTMRVKVSRNDILYLHNHKDKFTQFGLEWTVLNNDEIHVTSIPEAVAGKNSRPIDTIEKSVKNLLSELIHTIKCLKGNITLYPKAIMNLVFNEACRHAIKFGDALSPKDCKELILLLANCKTPFQCAHGRPVMAVMMELKFDTDSYKFNIENVKRFKNRIN